MKGSDQNENATLIGRVRVLEDILPNQTIARKFLQNIGWR